MARSILLVPRNLLPSREEAQVQPAGWLPVERQQQPGAGTETEGLPPPPVLLHSPRLQPTLSFSQDFGLKFLVPRRGSSRGSPKP